MDNKTKCVSFKNIVLLANDCIRYHAYSELVCEGFPNKIFEMASPTGSSFSQFLRLKFQDQ